MSSHLCKPLTSYSCLSKKKPKVRGDITEEALSEMCFGELMAMKRICLQDIYTTFHLLLYSKFWGKNSGGLFQYLSNSKRAHNTVKTDIFFHTSQDSLYSTFYPVLFETVFQEAETGTKKSLKVFHLSLRIKQVSPKGFLTTEALFLSKKHAYLMNWKK